MLSGHEAFTIVENSFEHMAIVKGLGMKQIVLNASQSLGF
jgi:hypothetical protein